MWLRVWENGFIERNPSAIFWITNEMVDFYIKETVKFTNLSSKPKEIKHAYFRVTAKGKKLGRGPLLTLKEGIEVPAFKTTPEPIKITTQMSVDEYGLRQLVGDKYHKAKVDIVLLVSGKISKTRVDIQYIKPK